MPKKRGEEAHGQKDHKDCEGAFKSLTRIQISHLFDLFANVERVSELQFRNSLRYGVGHFQGTLAGAMLFVDGVNCVLSNRSSCGRPFAKVQGPMKACDVGAEDAVSEICLGKPTVGANASHAIPAWGYVMSITILL